MSAIITGTTPVVMGLANNRRCNDDMAQFQYDKWQLLRARDSDIGWTRSGWPGFGAVNGWPGAIDGSADQWWEWNFPPHAWALGLGHSKRKMINGVVRDSTGAAVSGATVQLYNTATGLLVDTQTSLGDGQYIVGDPNNVSCFAVGYKTGSPDIYSSTVNTLTGS